MFHKNCPKAVVEVRIDPSTEFYLGMEGVEKDGRLKYKELLSLLHGLVDDPKAPSRRMTFIPGEPPMGYGQILTVKTGTITGSVLYVGIPKPKNKVKSLNAYVYDFLSTYVQGIVSWSIEDAGEDIPTQAAFGELQEGKGAYVYFIEETNVGNDGETDSTYVTFDRKLGCGMSAQFRDILSTTEDNDCIDFDDKVSKALSKFQTQTGIIGKVSNPTVAGVITFERKSHDDDMMSDILRQAVFTNHYDNDEAKTRTLYFDAPKKLVRSLYPEADATVISIEFPLNNQEAKEASVSFGPATSDGNKNRVYSWFDVDLAYQDIELLMDIAEKALKK